MTSLPSNMSFLRRTTGSIENDLLSLLASITHTTLIPSFLQLPLLYDSRSEKNHEITPELFADLEELSRIVDISYCVGVTGTGIQKPFLCASRCQDFKSFQLVTVGFNKVKRAMEAY